MVSRSLDAKHLPTNIGVTAWKMNRTPPRFTKAHAEQLTAHDWPGNIRELPNAVERAAILAQNGPLRFELPPRDAPPSNQTRLKVSPIEHTVLDSWA